MVAAQVYFPATGPAWERREPAAVGMDAQRLSEAVEFAIASESAAPRDLELAHYQSFGREPFGDAIGPFSPTWRPVRGRSCAAATSWRSGATRIGSTMTFSVTKSFLATTVGLAFDEGLIPDLHAPVHLAMAPVLPVEREGGSRYRAERFGEPKFLTPVRHPAQPADHLGPPAAADERLGGDALGEAGVGRPSRTRDIRRVASRRAIRAGERSTSTTTCG
jgi:hypothetical protein